MGFRVLSGIDFLLKEDIKFHRDIARLGLKGSGFYSCFIGLSGGAMGLYRDIGGVEKNMEATK